MTQFLRKFIAQHATSSTGIDNCSGDAPTTDYETIPDEIQVTRITADRRDILVAR